MAIPTTRTRENGTITIDSALCTGCGMCISVCKSFNIVFREGKATVGNPTGGFGCIGCGHCMAICPEGAIEIYGREISPTDVFDLPEPEGMTTYEPLLALLQRRRSIREYLDRDVEPEIIEKILEAAKTAPMGLPPSDINVLVFNSKEKSRAFAKDFSSYLRGMKFMTSGLFLALMRPFWGKPNDEMFKGFIKPLFSAYTDEMDKGENYINYDAPLLMYFYGSPYTDPADPLIAATYAMIAAESLGLGTCMLGAVHPFIQNGKKGKKFREKHGIRYKSKEGLFVAFGYPAVKYRKGIRRTFASVTVV
jgi:Fe-S-cluster-containing hydrogenase component 2